MQKTPRPTGRRGRIVLQWLVTAASLLLAGSAAPAQADLAGRLGQILRLADLRARLSACVVELPSGRILYEYNPDTPMIPASNMKLLTTAVALDMLGARFELRTRLAVKGDTLAIIGGGDPALGDPRLAERNDRAVTETFAAWARTLRDTGMAARVRKLLFDDSIFDGQRRHPGWPANEYQKWYCAPVGGLNFHDNCVDAVAAPAASGKVVIGLRPACSLFEIVNRCRVGPEGNPIVWRPQGTWKLIFSQRCAKRVELPPVTVPDPGLFAATVLRDTIRQECGVHLAGPERVQIRDATGRLAEGWRVVASVGTPIMDVIERCNTDSQNLFAECLFKLCGAAATGGVGSWPAGRVAVMQFLRRYELPRTGIVVDDGSGLSAANRVSARLLAMLLCEMFARPDWAAWRDTLAVAGRTGTLRKRFASVLAGKVFAKTGYIRGVSALSGYLQCEGGKWVAFSFLYNGIKGPTRRAKKAQEEACLALYKYMQQPASREAAAPP